MERMSLEQVDATLRAPVTIHAPDGTRFVLIVKVNEQVTSFGQLFRPDFLRYEMTGPDEQAHVWMFNHLLELVLDPEHEDVPRHWTIKAEIALFGWSRLTEELAP